MSNREKKGSVPELRFPEFKVAPAWQKKRLIDTADKNVKWSFIGGPFGSNLKASDYVKSGVRVIQLQNIGDGVFNDEYKIYTSEKKADELLSNNIYPNEIIMSKMGDPVGRACLIPENENRYVMCSDGIRLVVDKKQYSKYFVYTLINSKFFRALVEKTATGSTRKRIGLDDLKKLRMFLPKQKEEQQKIADCLNSIDNLVTTHILKLDALRVHKKSLMQQIFPAKGETVPILRFSEFEGSWSSTILGDCVNKVGSGITPRGGSKNYQSKGRPFVRSQNIGWGQLLLDDIVHINETVHASFLGTEIKEEDVLLNITGASIGRSAVADNRISGGNVNQHVCIIRAKRKVLNHTYLSQFILSLYGQSQIESFQAGGNREGLNFGQIRSFRIPTPPTIKEQETIADCLSSIDTLVAAEIKKIDSLKIHKSSLMQKLFPSMEEILK